MAGRPGTRARRLAEIDDRLWQLKDDFIELAPDRPMREQSSDQWWPETVRHLMCAAVGISILLYDLEERAGLPADELQRERDQRRGFCPCEEAEPKETENVDGAST